MSRDIGTICDMATGSFEARLLDQFYTRPDIARECADRVRSFAASRYPGAIWIEPSAGAGAFVDHLPMPKIALDIAPRRSDISQADFLDWQPGDLARDAIVIGNPPFGKNASLAQRFFNHAARFARVIAFIVPKTFQKESMINRLDVHMHLELEVELPLDAFVFAGQPYEVPTVFQIWERRDSPRGSIARKLTHPDFAFVPANDADFAFQRVGARAGLVSREGLRKSPQSHYFIRSHIDADALFDRLRGIDWQPVKCRTAGNPSIGKRELIHCYESVCG